MKTRTLLTLTSTLVCCVLPLDVLSTPQTGSLRSQMQSAQGSAASHESNAGSQENQGKEGELQTGTALTRKGKFVEAIPHLLAARGHVANEYAASFNLALCFVGTRQYSSAIRVLDALRSGEHPNPDVENLLAQAYVGNGQSNLAYEALERAAALTPTNEKLYLFVGDACMERHDYSLGLKVVDLGLKNVANSPHLHYQRAIFLSLLDEFDQARADFEQSRKLAPASEISYLSAANEELYAGNPAEAARWAREGINKGFDNPTLLTILGEALMRSGASAGEPDFVDAQNALEKATAMRPSDGDAHASLGKLYLMGSRIAEAIRELERSRDLEPTNSSVYASLAKAYQRHGEVVKAQSALATLATLNQQQAEKIRSAPGDRRASYEGSVPEQEQSSAGDQH